MVISLTMVGRDIPLSKVELRQKPSAEDYRRTLAKVRTVPECNLLVTEAQGKVLE